MREKLVLGIALIALAASSSLALAAAPPDKGKPGGEGKPADSGKPADKGKPTTGAGCKPAVQVVLKGTLAAAPGIGTALTVKVTGANKHGKLFVSAAQPVSVQLTTATKIRREGKKAASDLLVGDRVLVQARVCKADLALAALPVLTATKVIAHPATKVEPTTSAQS